MSQQKQEQQLLLIDRDARGESNGQERKRPVDISYVRVLTYFSTQGYSVQSVIVQTVAKKVMQRQ